MTRSLHRTAPRAPTPRVRDNWHQSVHLLLYFYPTERVLTFVSLSRNTLNLNTSHCQNLMNGSPPASCPLSFRLLPFLRLLLRLLLCRRLPRLVILPRCDRDLALFLLLHRPTLLHRRLLLLHLARLTSTSGRPSYHHPSMTLPRAPVSRATLCR
jgi:hypothetical protein